MEKEEKKAEWVKIISVWQLMKSLMDKKWIPRWYKEIIRAVYDRRHKMIWLYEDDWKEYFELVYKKSLRELVSTDSWLWQFVCENGMVKFKQEVYSKCIIGKQWDANDYKTYSRLEYRIIESALCDEDKLEDFILDNIKVDVESK